jgi:glycine cleavage system H protein
MSNKLSLFVDVFGVVESVKAASDLYSPVSGDIVEVNELLNESPHLVNEEPYDAGKPRLL